MVKEDHHSQKTILKKVTMKIVTTQQADGQNETWSPDRWNLFFRNDVLISVVTKYLILLMMNKVKNHFKDNQFDRFTMKKSIIPFLFSVVTQTE